MSWSKFQSDLNDGELGEKQFANWMLTRGWETKKFNKNNEWDILLEKGNTSITFEIKTDRWEHFHNKITNNMIIETRCRGKLSGISVSKANYFAYYYPDHELVYIIGLKRLRELINERGDLFRRIENFGDDNAVSGYICNRFSVENLFKVYKIKS
jgi:hypothetical protein